MFITEIADIAWNCYNDLGKSGKPKPGQEWTTLAAIAIKRDTQPQQLVALATGTKSAVRGVPDDIVDCHAESLLKRAFKRHLISRQRHRLSMDDWSVTMFISQLPCGVVQRWKGADLSRPEEAFGRPGVHRKPGRGQACHKSSCLNKLLKWNLLGLQGSRLLECTRRPIYVDSLVIGNCGPPQEFDQEMLAQLFKDAHISLASDLFKSNHIPQFMFDSEFRKPDFFKTESKASAPSAIVLWREGDGDMIKEIVTNGRQHGSTKKNAESHSLLISSKQINKEVDYLLHGAEPGLTRQYSMVWQSLKEHQQFQGWSWSLPSTKNSI